MMKMLVKSHVNYSYAITFFLRRREITNKWMTSDKMSTSFLRLAFQYNVILFVQNEIYIFDKKKPNKNELNWD